MSRKTQTEKKVQWCLNKAKRELEDSNKHRGLVKVSSDSHLAKSYLKKAEHNLLVFMDNKELGHYDWTISIGFYVMYHCCLSLLAKYGFESRNQECTFAAISFLIDNKEIPDSFSEFMDQIKNKDESDEILQLREHYQYTSDIEIDKVKVEELENLCKIMIQETKGVI